MATVTYHKIVKGQQSLQGGVDGVAGLPKIVTVEVVGTFNVGDKFNVQLGDNNYGYFYMPQGVTSAVLTLKRKVYAAGDSLLNFSAIDSPTSWDQENAIGAGFVNLLNEYTGEEPLTGLSVYNTMLAVFSRRGIQIWQVDVDPSRNSQYQVLDNIGAVAPRSILQVGDADVFFLSDTGVRSLRSRNINNTAQSSDVGEPIDPIVVERMRALGDAEAAKAVSVMDPVDGRYWLALGDEILVHSNYRSNKVSAWTMYRPGFAVTDFVVDGNRVYARSDGNRLFLYGGDDGATYDSSAVLASNPAYILLPYLNAGTPATRKTFTALDATVEGQWDFSIGTNPEVPGSFDPIARLWAPSIDMQRIPLDGASGVAFALKISVAGGGYARLSNVIMHYTANEAG